LKITRNILMRFVVCACLLCAASVRAAENGDPDARTERIVALLAEINRVPRCSHHEEKIAAWLEAWGRERGFPVVRDAADNVVISVAARGGMDNAPTVILQAHMDMVCVKTPESGHDFSKDPIKHIRDGEWLTADGTTLGADDGIGVAIALSIAEADDIAHPPLQLLFTTNEEDGMTGAAALSKDVLTGNILVNIDNEDEGHFCIGCAGGTTVEAVFEMNPEPVDAAAWRTGKIAVSGLRGGHSGGDIDKHRGNAIKILGRALARGIDDMPLRLAGCGGGTAFNAIAAAAAADIVLPVGQVAKFQDRIRQLQQDLRAEYAQSDPGILLTYTPAGEPAADARAMSVADTRRFVLMLLGWPCGIAEMCVTPRGLVETSNNLGPLADDGQSIRLKSLARSLSASGLAAQSRSIQAVGLLASATITSMPGNPPWQPEPDSDLLRQMSASYRRVFDTEPVVEVIHAGLECALLGVIYPDMEMIAIGPTLKDVHSPRERLHLPSVSKVWDLLVEFLRTTR
jgi:dipeptidase D